MQVLAQSSFEIGKLWRRCKDQVWHVTLQQPVFAHLCGGENSIKIKQNTQTKFVETLISITCKVCKIKAKYEILRSGYNLYRNDNNRDEMFNSGDK